MMLFVQVILGGSSVLLGLSVLYHLIWGTLTLIMLIFTTALTAKTFGTGATLFKVSVVAMIDFLIQGALGFISFGQGVPLVVHLTNAFVLAILVTYLISFADNADKAAITPKISPAKIPSM